MRWACFAALAGTMAAVVGLTSLVACSRPAPTPRKVSPEELRGITPANAVELTTFARRFERIVSRGERSTIEGMWVTAKDLEGCKLTGKTATSDELVAFAEERLEEFQRLADKHLADDLRAGKVIANNYWER